ncbi:ABC transporter substrate-binding protein [Aquibacillus saliphilus]|uniref:ABC transporter substrate-binding protein n=1 Tax=Aquibacillus saliphilus TaxID=1909422 RepID=UPI001CF0BAF4|nr:sugar ABC transporter substrate-binding protein [Aquibacillus saliphilus]
MKDQLTKGLVLCFSMILVLIIISGCSDDSSSNDNATGDDQDDTEQDNGSDTVTLRMVESLTSPARTELLKGMIEAFEDENPTIKVELISPPLQSADEKISQMLMAEEDIDVLEVRDQTVKQFSNNSFIEDLSVYTSEWENWDSLNDIAKHGATSIDEIPYFIPYGIYEKTLFYRKDWFEEAGLDVPETWEDVYNAATTLTDPSQNRYGYSFRGGAGSSDYVEFMTWSYVGENIVQDDGYFIEDGSPMFTTDEAVDALEMFVKIYEDASPPDSISWSYPEMVQGFTSGTTAMLIQDPEVIVTAEENMEEGTWDTAPLPKGTPSGVAQQTAGTAGWGIGAFSENKEEAWKLISFLSSPEQNLHFAKNNSLIPVHKSAGDDSFFKEGYFSSYIEMNAKPDEYLIADRPVDYKGWGEYRGVAEKDIQSLLLGDITIEDALQKWTDYWVDQKEQQ